jgi:hypothetical protein
MICGSKNPHEIIQHTRDNPKLKVFRALTKQKKVFRSIFFTEPTTTVYLNSVEKCLMPIFEEKSLYDVKVKK